MISFSLVIFALEIMKRLCFFIDSLIYSSILGGGALYLDLEFGRLQARDMLQHLWSGPISNASVDVVQGGRSVEVRAVGVTKVHSFWVSSECFMLVLLMRFTFSCPH